MAALSNPALSSPPVRLARPPEATMSSILALGSPLATSSGSGSGSGRRHACQHRYHAAAAAAATRSLRARAGTSTPQQQDAASLDVSGAVVQPSFRSAPWQPNEGEAGTASGPEARVLMVSESGVCRAVLAAAALKQLLEERGLGGRVDVDCRASRCGGVAGRWRGRLVSTSGSTPRASCRWLPLKPQFPPSSACPYPPGRRCRNYCVGDGPDPNAALVAAELDWELPRGYMAEQFNEARDIVAYDLVLVVDKFVAADVLREVGLLGAAAGALRCWGGVLPLRGGGSAGASAAAAGRPALPALARSTACPRRRAPVPTVPRCPAPPRAAAGVCLGHHPDVGQGQLQQQGAAPGRVFAASGGGARGWRQAQGPP